LAGARAVDIEHRVETPVATTSADVTRRVLTIALLVLPAVIILWCGWQRRWTADDGFINLRVVRQVTEGHGPVFNAGQRVETGTSPAWIALLSLLDVLTPIRLEWIAALTGLATTAGAVLLMVFGTRRALLSVGVAGTFLPLGALAYVSVPPAWDFATSGLETGLALLWLGLSWWLLAGLVGGDRVHHVPWYVPLTLGAGFLVRPDFLIVSVGFVVAAVVLCGRREALRVVLWAALLPVVLELARMVYFASLVPNTALAKEASLARWSQGWDYLVDFAGTYVLLVPLALLGLLGWLELRHRPASGTRRFAVLAAIVAVSGALHALYVVRVGGDFMHARLLLPAFFVVLLPVSVVVVSGWARLAAAVVAVWALAAMFGLRPSYSGAASRPGVAGSLEAIDIDTGIGDERLFYSRWSSERNPVTIDDYLRHNRWARSGAAIARRAAQQRPVLVLDALAKRPIVVPLRPGSAPRTVASAENLGVYGYAAGTGVDVIDDHGLADVVASHERLRVRGRPGHEKALPEVWTFARYAAPGAPLPKGVTARDVAAARHALSCGDLARLADDTDGSWSIGDAPRNLIDSMRTFRFRFSEFPVIAEREVCGS
jgi:arabinofuranosyltransferase